MTYPEYAIAPMRQELVSYGLEEARTAADVDRLLGPDSGTVLMVVNSVCGCAAGKARPGLAQALRHKVKPQKAATVFAGADLEAVERLREILAAYPPSSPSITLFKNGQPVYLMHRSDIEPRNSVQIAELLTKAFDQFCATPA